jgi:hypothetical protein
MAAMTGATGARTWLQAQHASWLTPERMRVATVGIFAAATLGSSVALGGSSAPNEHPAQPGHAPASAVSQR